MPNAFSTVPADQRVALINEKVTGPPSVELLRLSDISSQGEVVVLDNATGAGILTDNLLGLGEKTPGLTVKRVVAGDLDDTMLAFADDKAHKSPYNWDPVQIEKIDQQSIPRPDASFTHVFANFGIFFCQDDAKALSEAYRVLKPSGIAGFTSWKSIQWWSDLTQPALAKYLPDAPALPPPAGLFPRAGWTDPTAIPSKLEKAGFEDVRVSAYRFQPLVGPEEFAEATGALVKKVAERLWPEGAFAEHAGGIEASLLRYLKENYADGIWDGYMTAIITLGKKP